MTLDPRDATTRKGVTAPKDQDGPTLAGAAEHAASAAEACAAADAPLYRTPQAEALAGLRRNDTTPPAYTCKLRLKVAIFFDGTGNNLEADIPTREHSNVARLYRSHDLDNKPTGLYRFYVPGLGTYFREIGDPGDPDGLAFGKFGDARLEWAMKQLDAVVVGHPPANITGLDIALFGFSRGAALARAFAIRLQKRCEAQSNRWRWDKGGFDASIYFMGLFDTVASVGFPASSSELSLRIAKKWTTLDEGLKSRRMNPGNGLEPWSERPNLGIAFGDRPGADPTPGAIDGHGAWASDLRIPPMVERCVHFVSAHEQRNSFPLDSAREGRRYPACVHEGVYPGVHSNVGGGYRPGEGGKSLDPDQLLSLLPLRAMHDEALAIGVPLGAKTEARSGDDFKVSAELIKRFNAYQAVANAAASSTTLEGRMLAHTRLLFAWRFKRMRERGAASHSATPTVATEERKYAAERAQLDKQIAAAEKDPARLEAQQRLARAQREQEAAKSAVQRETRRDWPNSDSLAQALARERAADTAAAAAQADFSQADDARLKLAARQATLPGGGLDSKLDIYDQHLLLDVQAIQNVRRMYPNARLRPHYVNLMAAYEAEYEQHKGLLDDHPDALEFFDHYVHDSLAGFGMDATLPSDPRVIYIGKDNESHYARRAPSSTSEPAPTLVG